MLLARRHTGASSARDTASRRGRCLVRTCVAQQQTDASSSASVDRRAALLSVGMTMLSLAPAAQAGINWPKSVKAPAAPPPSAESVVKKAIGEFKKLNSKGLSAVVSNTVVWDLPDRYEKGERKGMSSLVRYIDRLKTLEKVEAFSPKKFVVDSKARSVAVFGSTNATVIKTGKPYTSDWVISFEVDDTGKVSRIRQYVDTKAISAAYV